MALAHDELPNDVAALKALLVASRSEAASANAKATALGIEADRLKRQNSKLEHIIAVLRRAQFGRSSERISEDQLNLALDDVQTGIAVDDAKAEKANDTVKRAATAKRRRNRGSLPEHLPREEIVVEPESTACPCCGGALHRIGEDTSERLDKVPAKLRVLVTRRPKCACRACKKTGADDVAGVVQAPAPLRLIEGGIPTEALVADVLVAKYADHLPLYRQAQMLAREGVILNRSTLCHWVGYAAAELGPLHARS